MLRPVFIVRAVWAAGAAEVGWDEIEAALSDLRSTLDYATPEEQKALVQEHIREIWVPKKGLALLETDPTGLLSPLGVCEFLVTPRGVDAYATLVMTQNPALLVIKLLEAA